MRILLLGMIGTCLMYDFVDGGNKFGPALIDFDDSTHFCVYITQTRLRELIDCPLAAKLSTAGVARCISLITRKRNTAQRKGDNSEIH